MERGLLWLPLLAVFFWLAWSGWKEYQKVEAYRNWAQQFERAKYDIYSVLGQKNNELTWGVPTSTGPINIESFSLEEIQSIQLLVDNQAVDLETLPTKGRTIALAFIFPEPASVIKVPFTEIPLAAEWGKYLQQQLNTVRQNLSTEASTDQLVD